MMLTFHLLDQCHSTRFVLQGLSILPCPFLLVSQTMTQLYETANSAVCLKMLCDWRCGVTCFPTSFLFLEGWVLTYTAGSVNFSVRDLASQVGSLDKPIYQQGYHYRKTSDRLWTENVRQQMLPSFELKWQKRCGRYIHNHTGQIYTSRDRHSNKQIKT